VQRLGNWFDPLPGIYWRTLARLDHQNVKAATRVLVNSHYSRETLYRTYGIFAHVAYLGVDTEKFRPLGLPRENFVLSVGALNPRKGFDFLIESLAFLEASQRPQLVIVSNFQDARERQFLEKLATEKQVRVTFKAMIPDEDLVRLYNQAQLTLYAPIMEPFGFVPLESMACGTPVVGVREAGVRETVRDGVTGVLTEREPRLMAVAIRDLLNAPALITEYSAKARKNTVTHWSWEHAITTLEHFLNIEGGICTHS
jgi:glycosyltransferase involved in cell wall biosynthesis